MEEKKEEHNPLTEKKTGRPKLLPSEKKNQTVLIRMTEAEKQLLEQKSKSEMMSMSDYIRTQIFNPTPSHSTKEIVDIREAAIDLKQEWDDHQNLGSQFKGSSISVLFKTIKHYMESDDSQDQ